MGMRLLLKTKEMMTITIVDINPDDGEEVILLTILRLILLILYWGDS